MRSLTEMEAPRAELFPCAAGSGAHHISERVTFWPNQPTASGLAGGSFCGEGLRDAKLDELPPSERMLPCFRIGQFGGYVLRPSKLPLLATDAPRTITYGIFFIPV